MTYVIRSAAKADIDRQFRFYLLERDVPEVARRWINAVESAVKAICEHPEIGSLQLLPDLAGIRAWPVPGFSDIRLYYLVGQDQISLIRVLHGKRDVKPLLQRRTYR